MEVKLARRMVPAAALAAVVVMLAGCGPKKPAAQPKPPVVKVATVVAQTVPIESHWIATLQGFVNAQIQPHVTGYVIRQDYREGSYVPKGSVLFEIDPRPFQAVLDQAKGQLAQAEAQLENAVINVNRDIPEAQAKAIPQSQLDTDTQAKLAAKAAVEAAKAAVESAQLNLGYTKVRSLVGGIAGIAQVQVGNLVSPTTVLTGVSQVSPIKAYFPITGNQYLELANRDDPPGAGTFSSLKDLPIKLTLSNGVAYNYPGRVLFANRQVNTETGTIQIVGSFPNPQRVLRPGQTGQVSAITEIRHNALVIPQRAVIQLQSEDEVAVVGPNNRVAIRDVTLGPQTGTDWIINQGLKAGDRVVAEGAQNLRDGMAVTPEPYVYKPSSGVE